jgi:hypothetical protein
MQELLSRLKKYITAWKRNEQWCRTQYSRSCLLKYSPPLYFVGRAATFFLTPVLTAQLEKVAPLYQINVFKQLLKQHPDPAIRGH